MNAKHAVPLLAAAYLLIGCGTTPTSATPAPDSSTVAAVKANQVVETPVKVKKQDLIGYAFFDAKVYAPPSAQVNITSPYDVPVQELLVHEGSRVERGATLLKMQMPGGQDALTMAQSNLKSAEDSYRVAREQAGSGVADAQRAVDDARAAYKAASTDGSDATDAFNTLNIAKETLRAAKADQDAKTLGDKQGVDAAMTSLKEARTGANMGLIRAPISGTVMNLKVKTGDVMTNKETVATIVNLRAIKVQGVVPADMASKVKTGTPVIIAVAGPNLDPLDGRVASVDVLPPTKGQSSGAYTCVIDFDNSKGLVLPNTYISRVGVRTGKAEDALVVPVTAVTKDANGRAMVQVKVGDQWTTKAVTLGVTDGVLIQIKSGLNEGDTVQTRTTILK